MALTTRDAAVAQYDANAGYESDSTGAPMSRRRALALPDISGAFADLRSDYDAARDSQFTRRRQGIHPNGSGADYHYRHERDWLKILELARDIDRNDLLVGQGVDRVVDNVVQTGIVRDAQTGDKEADEILEDLWDDWAENPVACHDEQRLNWHQLERLIFRAAFIVDGDHLVFPTDEGGLWCVESHRLRKPRNTRKNVVHGLELDTRNRVSRYWVTNQDIGADSAIQRVSDVTQYPAFDDQGNQIAWFVADPKRVSQRRGITRFVPIAKAAGMHDDSLFAQLLKQQIANCITIVREMGGLNLPPGFTGEAELRTSESGSERLYQHLFPGMEIVGKPGEKMSMFSPNIGTSDSANFSLLILNILAVNLGIPVAVLLLDPSNTNFSGWRGAIDEARKGFKRMARDYISQLHYHVWRWHVRQSLALETPEGVKLRAIWERIGPKIFGHRWNAKAHGYIEPLKDATANHLRQGSLQTSPRRLHAEMGQNWFEVIDEGVEDNGYAIEKAVLEQRRLKALYPEELKSLHWREVLSLVNTEKLSIAVSNDGAAVGASTKPEEQPNAV